jgi:hypothetical protein
LITFVGSLLDVKGISSKPFNGEYLKFEYNSFALSSWGFHSSYNLSIAILIGKSGFSEGITAGKTAKTGKCIPTNKITNK